ncbi:alpha/beta hydrolase [Stieleria sp. JC731]|uniref:alpha/beta hydrolase n=1 Tax=Pirellulaceae TaxID=2691357 RepID=UPI001E5E4A97|nr:alpha/beta hydrolase [Stieleria sp. JC731]MCC9600076.1 alpha/beta hydrolase [Stieleria sp. JC731]
MSNSDDLKSDPDSQTLQPSTLARWKRRTVVCVRTLIAVYVVILLTMVLMEARLLFPAAYHDVSPSADSLASAWTYSSTDGSPIIGQLFERPDAERTVLFLHGNATFASRQAEFAKQLSGIFNANILVAEYRAFVDDEVTPSESNLIADSIAAFDALRDHYELNDQDIIVYGRSLGGGCAAAIAEQRQIEHLVLDRTFDSAANVAAGRYPFIPVHLVMSNQFDSIRRLRSFEGNLIQFHGETDEVIPFENGRNLYEMASTANKHFIQRDEFGHLKPISDEVLRELFSHLPSTK